MIEATSVQDVLDDGISFLESAAVEEADIRAEWLLTFIIGVSRTQFRLQKNRTITENQSKRFSLWLQRCADGEPVQYITGETEFFGFPFEVSESVLIPRPETERVVEIASETATLSQACSVLEIGTGSGCIAISLAKMCPGLSITAIDVSPAAIRMASRNSKKNGAGGQISFCQLDILNNEPESQYDMLISNPPYVPLEEYTFLDETVKYFEPQTALTDGGDGLTFYRRLAKDGHKWLRPGGKIILEVGRNDHPDKAAELFRVGDWAQVELFEDYNGDARVLKVQQA
ncbi:MAG: peptide chain release factor N(5)-glutamine methyltransferase [Candidatus Neomarinimicrobiota bacterium]|nr:peptide chain release factor N(5)-glutamine methyltransferase [Candidatus Neomarinimicrobiota bacterium]